MQHHKVTGTDALILELEQLDLSITALKDNHDRQGRWGGRNSFASLNQQGLRAALSRTQERRLEVVAELRKQGVEIATVQRPEKAMPVRVYEVRVIEGGPTGLVVMFAGSVGCLHKVECVRPEDAERIAIEEHKEKCNGIQKV
jgi:hypothetical protein